MGTITRNLASSYSTFEDNGQRNLGFVKDENGDEHLQNYSESQKPCPSHQLTSIPQESESSKPERDQWSNPREFLLSCISMAVGVGNVWRFPFVALENGGGAFLVPYILVLLFIGKPLYYMEFCLGQFASANSIKVWDISPAFRGVGYGQAFSTWIVSTYYVSLMALCTFFFFASFNSTLPWSVCGPWAADNCVDSNFTHNPHGANESQVTAAEEYFMKVVLQEDPLGFRNGIGAPEWRLSLCLLFSWLVVFMVQIKGIRSSGKAAYFTALFPYTVLFIMLGRGVTLPGAYKGILFFITPHWERLLDPGVWYAAVDQAFFSLGVGFGLITMLASYNTFDHNIYRDATILSLADTFTSLLAGFTIFSVLGHFAELLGVEVADVVKGGGTSLAFISYPDVLARFQFVPQVFSLLFFFMLFTLGTGSAVAYNGVIITIVCDKYPHVKKWIVTLAVCVLGFLVGLIYTTPEGQHIVTLLNHYGGGVSIIFLMILQLVAVMWVYGIKKFILDIEFMLKRKTSWYWRLCWAVFNPLFLTVVFVYSQAVAKPLTYGDYVFGPVATGVGISISLIAGMMIPLLFLLEFKSQYKKFGTLQEALLETFRSTPDWAPRDKIIRQAYHKFLAHR